MDDASPYESLEDDTSGPYESLEDENPHAARLTPPGDFRQEGAYQGWLEMHAKPQQPGRVTRDLEFPGTGYEKGTDADHTLSLGSDYNAVTHDLRGMWNKYATQDPVSGQLDLEPTAAQIDEFALPGMRGFTADSKFAKGVPADQLGSWNDDHTEYHPPGWQPESATARTMKAASEAAGRTYDQVSAGLARGKQRNLATESMTDQALADQTLADPLKIGAQSARQNLAVVGGQTGILDPDTVADQIASAEKAKPPLPAFRRAADEQREKAGSFLGVLDSYVENPRATLATVMQGLSEGGVSLGLATGGGAAAGAVGGPVGAALGTAAGAGTGGYLDAYGSTILQTIKASGVDLADKDAVSAALKDPALMAKAAAAGEKAGIPAAIINAISFGVAGKLYEPAKTLAGGGRLGTAAGIGAETVGQAGIGAGGEATREAVQDDKMDPGRIAEAGLSQVAPTLAFTALHARGRPAESQAETQAEAEQPAGGFNIDDVKPQTGAPALGGSKASASDTYYPGYRWDPDAPNPQPGNPDRKGKYVPTGEQPSAQEPKPARAAPKKAQENNALESPAAEEPPPREERPGEPPIIDAEFQDLPPKAKALTLQATNPDAVTVEHTDSGSVVKVDDVPISTHDTPEAAEQVAQGAREAIETEVSKAEPAAETPLERTQPMPPERRSNTELRQRVNDMTPEQLRAALLQDHLTPLLSKRGWDERDARPTMIHMDLDSLKALNDQASYDTGDQILKAAGHAIADEFGSDHGARVGGDEFKADHDTPEAAHEAMNRLNQRLAGTKIEVTLPDGRKVNINGIGLSYGVGASDHEAETNLHAHKASREAEGTRSPRGQLPAGTTITAPETRGESDQSHPAAEEAGREEIAPEKPPAVEGQTHLGTNAEGEHVYEDEKGVRTAINPETGSVNTENVGLRPVRGPNGTIKYEHVLHNPEDPRFEVEKPADVEKAKRAARAPKVSRYTINDLIDGDGPETVIVRHYPDGKVTAAIGEAADDRHIQVDITKMIEAGATPERAIAQHFGEDTSGKNVERQPETQPAPDEAKEPPAVEGAAAEAQTETHGNGNLPAERVPETGARADEGNAAVGDRNREPVDEGMAESGERAPENGPVPEIPESAGGTGTERVEPAGESASGESRDSGTVRPESEAADAGDHRLDNEELGKGSLRSKYRDNVAAIKILKALDTEGRVATPEERSELARYVGWGAMKGVFDPANKQWAKQHEELKSLLTPAEWRAARASTLNAHYTSKPVVKGIFDAIQHLGFDRGRVLEPSVGTGNFFGLMPPDMRGGSELHGVELDPLTAKIAKALYPSANIKQMGFQDFDIPAEYFDAVIGNPPFGNEPIVDSARSPYSGASIHNYFLSKAIDKLRPGGIMAVVVSHNFLDARNSKTREWIAQHADLIGAARLPQTAFKDTAGTEVVTDVVVLQKRAPNTKGNGDQWVDTVTQKNRDPKTDLEHEHSVNKWMANRPENVLGEPSAAGTMYRPGEYTVMPTGDLDKQIDQWVQQLPQGIYTGVERGPLEADQPDVAIPEGVKVGSYFVDSSGAVRTRTPDALGRQTSIPWQHPNLKALDRVKRMIGLRDLLREQMRMERSGEATPKDIEKNRKKLNAAYDQFLTKYGLLNTPVNRRLFLDDTEAPLVLALEFDYDRGVGNATAEREGIEARPPSARKADIFKQRVLFPPADNIKVSNAKDALLASLNFKGTVDPQYMSQVYDKSPEAIEHELGDVVFRDPQKGLVTADEYLSGDVKTKLEEAKAAALEKNVAALEKVIPQDKLPSQIHATLGAAFVPEDVYGEFYRHITGAPHEVRYVPALGQWFTKEKGQFDNGRNGDLFGTKDISAQGILDKTMAGQAVLITRVMRNSDGSTSTVVMQNETELARAKQEAIKDEWKKWLWSDAERADRVAGIYNDKLNRIVNRKFDGLHLTFPGMSPAISLLDHQKNAVWRGLQSRQMLLDHVVGAGKTYAMATLAMEMRRLGISRKPMLAVPNHLTGQWRSEFSKLYPSSYILVAEPEDFQKANRQKFFSKIATGDWDAVIVGHSSLKKIGLPPETEKKIITEQMDRLSEAIEMMKRERGDRNIIRDMENIKARLEAKFKTKVNNLGERDKVVSFDELGLDSLMVDELHEFKNLFYTSTMARAAGMGNPTGSDKAFDLFVKSRWLTDTFGDKAPIIGATGTPVSNSLVEMYNMQRYLQYPTLQKMGLDVFDSWAKQFGNMESVYEVAPSGTGWRNSTRFQKFANLPALMSLYKTFADTVTLDNLKAQETAQGRTFPVPKLETGAPINVVAPRSKLQENFMGTPKMQMAADGLPDFGLSVRPGDPNRIKSLRFIKDDKTGKYEARGMRDDDREYSLGTGYETQEDAEMAMVQRALTPSLAVDPESILGKFENLRRLMKESKGKINALSITGAANKAGLDYRLIDPTAPDHPGSKINRAVENIVENYKRWDKDKGTQLVFCDLSVPLSARASSASAPRLVYVRDPSTQLLTHKRGTMHTVVGHEQIPYFAVERGTKDEKRIDVYDAASGRLVNQNLKTKAEAHQWAKTTLDDENARTRWHLARNEVGEIDQDSIDDYNNTQEIDPEETPIFGRDDIAGASGPAKFSVYDDIKAKLIKAGIPAREVAFIHDYNSPTAKQKLFDQVNAGDIRVLLGSTAKMGAGTNVQKRAVGLHHIDAPWRPSDLEQRDGRVIRRGNMLYDRDPDGFRMRIYRYATAQTYDTRRWQVLEHKARGIEQLRNYDSSIEEIDDIEGQAADAADMKAAASGDPLILEETKLRNEVQALERLSAATADQQAAMRQKARQARQYANVTLPDQIARLKAEGKIATANPPSKEGWAPLEVAGKEFHAIDKFEPYLADIVASMRNKELTVPVRIEYRGLAFQIEARASYDGSVAIKLKAPSGEEMSYYTAKDTVSPSGFLTRLANYVANIPDRIEFNKRQIESSLKTAEDSEEASKRGFDKQKELDDARARFKKVRNALLAKGPPVSDEERPMFESGTIAQREGLEDLGLGERLHEFERGQKRDMLARGDGAGGMPKAEVERQAQAIIDGFTIKPKGLVVVQSARELARTDLGPNMRAAAAAGANPIASYFPGTGKIYIVADAIKSPEHLAGIVAHEMVVHFGLRSMLGSPYSAEYRQLLRNIAQALPAATDFHGRREISNYDPTRKSHKQIGAEEALAYYEQAQAQGGKIPPAWKQWIDKVHQIVRDWLRKIAGLPEKFDDLYVRNVLNALRQHLRSGRDRSTGEGDASNAMPKDTFYSSVERVLAEDGEGEGGSNSLPAHIVKITPEMRNSVLEGMPLFARPMFARDGDPAPPYEEPLKERTPSKVYMAARRAATSLVDNRLVMDIRKILNPKDVSAVSKEVAARTIPYLGELAHMKAQAQERLEEFARVIGKLSPQDQLDMIHAIETGQRQPIAALQPAADAMRQMLDFWRDQVRALGDGYLENYLENYFPHFWQDKASDVEKLFASIQGRRTMRGPATFLKQRVVPTIRDGIEWGLTPATINPLVMTLLKVHEMQRFISGVSMMRSYKEHGLAVFQRAGKPTPAGWVKIDDPIARVSQWSEEEQGFIERGHYIMPEDGGRIINNHLSASRLRNFAPAQAFRFATNLLNSMQLGLSAFHLGFTTLDAMVSKNALAIEHMMHFEPIRAAGAFLEAATPAGAIMNIRRGYQLMQAYLNPSGATPELKALVAALAAGGGRVKMDTYFMPTHGQSPFRGYGLGAIRGDIRAALAQPHDKVSALTKAIGNIPVEYAQKFWNELRVLARINPAFVVPFEVLGRITRATTSPIMEYIVPWQKLGVFSDLASNWIRRNPGADAEDVAKAMQSIWRSVDNRLGEMVYDDKFWDRTFKDTLHLTIRAVGWNFGTIEEIGGAPHDVLKAVDKGLRTGKINADDFGHKATYVMGLMFTTAVIGAITQYLMTGKGPDELKDYIFPKTGRLLPDGAAERIALPSYAKDIWEYAHHPGTTIIHKANPIFGEIADQWNGTDYFGHPIYNPSDKSTVFDWHSEDRAKHFFGEALPFSVQGQKQLQGAKEPGFTGEAFSAMPFVGLAPAPGVVTNPEKIESFQHYKELQAWKDKLQFDLKQARKAGDKTKIQDIQRQLQDSRRENAQEHSEYMRRKMEAQKRIQDQKRGGNTSELMRTIGPLIDGSSSRAEMQQRIEKAGYPALAGLLGNLPDEIRPQVKAKLAEYA
jgi:diguanylate cyclase (GGDEF)-like protein